MLKFILLGLGFVLLFEGLVYFVFSNKLKKMFEIIKSYESEKIRYISSFLIISGLCLIYFTLKFYNV
jgi:uncharacterized protein YjeT (DUF2065 family)